MDLGLIVSIGSLLVAVSLAILRYREYKRDLITAARAGVEEQIKAPAERESIIVGGATQAVQVLREALGAAYADSKKFREERDQFALRLENIEKQVETKDMLIRDQTSRISHLERELAELTNKEGAE